MLDLPAFMLSGLIMAKESRNFTSVNGRGVFCRAVAQA